MIHFRQTLCVICKYFRTGLKNKQRCFRMRRKEMTWSLSNSWGRFLRSFLLLQRNERARNRHDKEIIPIRHQGSHRRPHEKNDSKYPAGSLHHIDQAILPRLGSNGSYFPHSIFWRSLCCRRSKQSYRHSSWKKPLNSLKIHCWSYAILFVFYCHVLVSIHCSTRCVHLCKTVQIVLLFVFVAPTWSPHNFQFCSSCWSRRAGLPNVAKFRQNPDNLK